MTGHLLTVHLVDGVLHVGLGELLAERPDLIGRVAGKVLGELGSCRADWPTYSATGLPVSPGVSVAADV